MRFHKLPQDLASCTALRVLTVPGACLHELPTWLSSLTGLQDLHLGSM